MPNYKKMKMAIGGPSDVETREEYKGRRMAETEAGNLNRMEKISPNPVNEEKNKRFKEQKEKEQMRERIKEQKKYKRDPYGDA
jgi:hypothetical protein